MKFFTALLLFVLPRTIAIKEEAANYDHRRAAKAKGKGRKKHHQQCEMKLEEAHDQIAEMEVDYTNMKVSMQATIDDLQAKLNRRDDDNQQLVQYNPDCGTHPLYYGQWPNCPYPTVDTINVYNHCSEDITVDGWGEIATGGQLAPAPQLRNPTQPDTTDRIGYWYTSAPQNTYSFIELNYGQSTPFGPGQPIKHTSNSDWKGFSIPVEMKAMKADHSPACVDSGFKTTYDPPAKQSNGTFSCPYGAEDNVKPADNTSLCQPTDPNSPNMLLKSTSYVWNGCELEGGQPCDYGGKWSQTTYKSAINGGVNHNAAAQYWCHDHTCEDTPTNNQPVAAFAYCYEPTIPIVEITFCPGS